MMVKYFFFYSFNFHSILLKKCFTENEGFNLQQSMQDSIRFEQRRDKCNSDMKQYAKDNNLVRRKSSE